MYRINYFSWIMLGLAVGVLWFVISEAGSLEIAAADRANVAANEAQQLDKSAYIQRLHAIATDTKNERDTLNTFVHLDIVSTVQELERTGKSAGVNVVVTDASPESGGTSLPGGETLQWTSFSLTADGASETLLHAEEQYEHLPYAAKISQFDLQKTTDGAGKGNWHMTMRIRILAIINTS